MRKRVEAARQIQHKRFAGTAITCNARIPAGKLLYYCPLDQEALDFLHRSFDMLGMSVRGYDRIVKVSRTIADLAGSPKILKEHVAEALGYRTLDQKYWYEHTN